MNSDGVEKIEQEEDKMLPLKTGDIENGAGKDRILMPLRIPWLYDREDSLLDEVIAWIWFDVANSIYSSVGMVAFVPLVLNSYATTQAWALSERDQPPYCSDLETAYSEACIECRIGEGDLLCTGSGTGRENCSTLNIPTIGGLDPTGFAFFIISMSCISQLVAFMIWGKKGDYSDHRKQYLLVSSLVGAASLVCFAFFPVSEGYAKHIVAAILTVVANTSFGLAQIFYNAYLPLMASDLVSRFSEAQEDIENKVSSYGLASGYWSGVFGLVVSIFVLVAAGGTSDDASELKIASSFRWVLVWVGLYWFIGTLLTVPRLGNRPGKDGSGLKWYDTAQGFYETIMFTYKRLPITFQYLVLYFVYSDGFSTISGAGVLYARLDMCADTSALFVIAIEAPLCAALGNFIFLWISRKFAMSNRNMVVMVLVLISFLPIWGLLGYFSNTLGFRNMWEAYLLGAYFGFSLGAIENFKRTFFLELIPRSMESEYFSFYELTDKGSSWLGPLVVSGLVSLGTLRVIFFYILIMTLIPAFFLSRMDIESGKAAVAAVDEEVHREAESGSDPEGTAPEVEMKLATTAQGDGE